MQVDLSFYEYLWLIFNNNLIWGW